MLRGSKTKRSRKSDKEVTSEQCLDVRAGIKKQKRGKAANPATDAKRLWQPDVLRATLQQINPGEATFSVDGKFSVDTVPAAADRTPVGEDCNTIQGT